MAPSASDRKQADGRSDVTSLPSIIAGSVGGRETGRDKGVVRVSHRDEGKHTHINIQYLHHDTFRHRQLSRK